jgi:hypothetical protein
MGALAGVTNSVLNVLKCWDANKEEQYARRNMYFVSALAYFGTGATSFLLALGAWSTRQILRGAVESALVRIGVRYAGRVVVASLTGWGLVLLGLGVLFEAGAVLLTPSEIQTWARKGRYGISRERKFATWADEEKALLHLFEPLSK